MADEIGCIPDGLKGLEGGGVIIFAIQMGHLWPWMSREPVSGL